MKRLSLAVAALSLASACAFAASVKSGLKPGASVPAFDVVDVSGPNKGKQLCYRCSYGNAPVVAAFIKGDAAKAAPVLAGVQKLVDSNKAKGLKSFVVFMGGTELKGGIEKIAAERKISVPMTILPQGPAAADIAAYKISPEADVTIMLWNQGKVAASFANPSQEQWQQISEAASSMLR